MAFRITPNDDVASYPRIGINDCIGDRGMITDSNNGENFHLRDSIVIIHKDAIVPDGTTI